MACTKEEMREWLERVPDGSLVGVDDGGLALVVVGAEDNYFEIGGVPLEEGEESGG